MKKDKIFLVDGNSYSYRAFYAIRDLSNSKGLATNAIYGFFNMLNKIFNEEFPSFIAVCFDMKMPTFRHKLYEEYKMHRKPMPDKLVAQLPWIKKILHTLNIAVFEKQGFEADDVIATLAVKLKGENRQIYIASRDKDILQLIDEDVFVYRADNSNYSIFRKEDVEEKYGVFPNRISDFLALKGDSSDNIPGIPGIGKKTAALLINKYNNLENLKNNVDNIESEKIRSSLKQNIENLDFSKKLVELDTNVPIEFELDDLKFSLNFKKLIPIFQELGFNSLINKIESNR